MDFADQNETAGSAVSNSPVDTIERLPLPPTPPPIRDIRLRQGPPPPTPGSAASTAWRSPQASANPTQLLGPAAAVRSTNRTTRNVVIGLVLFVLVGIVASGVIFVRAFENTTLVTNLDTGDCLADFFEQGASGDYVEVFFVETTPCEEAHALEVYAVTDLLWGGDAYPGLDAAFSKGEDWCFLQYDAFIGGDYMTSPYEVWTFVPQEASWNAGDRTVQCLVGRYDEVTLTWGTLEGIDR